MDNKNILSKLRLELGKEYWLGKAINFNTSYPETYWNCMIADASCATITYYANELAVRYNKALGKEVSGE